MIALEVDFNHADTHGRLLLADLGSHEVTPFGELAASGDPVVRFEMYMDLSKFIPLR